MEHAASLYYEPLIGWTAVDLKTDNSDSEWEVCK